MQRVKKRGLVIAAAVVGAFVAGVLGAELWLKQTVRGAIERALEGTEVHIETGRVSVSIPLRSVTVRDVRVRVRNNDPSRRGFRVVSLDLTLESISARGIGYKKAGDRPALSVGRLIVSSPRATLVTEDLAEAGQSTAATENRKTITQTISEKLSSLEIGELSVNSAALDHVRWLSEGVREDLTLGGATLAARALSLDSLPADISLAVDSIVYGFDRGAQVVRVDSLVLGTAGRSLFLKSLAVVPQFPKEEFAAKSRDHGDWTAVTIENIACTGFDFGRLLVEKRLSVDSVSLAAADISSYKNRKVFSPPRTKPMLQQIVRQLPLPVEIGTLAFDNLDITYEELPERGGAPGAVILNGGRGTVANLTNIAEDHDRFISVEYAATLMHSGSLEAKLLLPVDAADDRWELAGRLGSTDMQSFNVLLEPLMNIRIERGRIRSLDFHVAGTLDGSHSKIAMAYNDLRVSLLDRRDHARERRLLSRLADDFLIRSDNPGAGGRLRETEGEHTRDPERSMWSHIWHSLLPAILKTII